MIESVHEAIGGAIVGTCLAFGIREYQILPRAAILLTDILPKYSGASDVQFTVYSK